MHFYSASCTTQGRSRLKTWNTQRRIEKQRKRQSWFKLSKWWFYWAHRQIVSSRWSSMNGTTCCSSAICAASVKVTLSSSAQAVCVASPQPGLMPPTPPPPVPAAVPASAGSSASSIKADREDNDLDGSTKRPPVISLISSSILTRPQQPVAMRQTPSKTQTDKATRPFVRCVCQGRPSYKGN